ncbi:MAG: metallophosphoesterase [Melioribacteraceae bacterium]
MNFLFMILLLFLIIIVFQFYFVRKTSNTILHLFPRIKLELFKKIRWIFVAYVNLLPVGILLGVVYYFITKDIIEFPPLSIIINYLFVLPFWIYFVILLQSIVFFLIIDVIRLVTYPVYKKHKDQILNGIYKAQFVLVIFFSVYVPARIIYDFNSVEIREVQYHRPVDERLKSAKIVLISDIQADPYTNDARLSRFVNKVNSLNPDLILIAGDLITSGKYFVDISAKYSGMLKSKNGVYSCVGDHDNWVDRSNTEQSLRTVEEALAKKNVFMLDNENRYFDINGAKVEVSFVTNTYVETIKNEALKTITNGGQPADFKIFLTHQPRQKLIDAAIKNNYNMYLAGHTHGGQITLLFPFINLSPTLFETNYVKGDFYFGDMLMIVTRGLGMSLAPVRYNATPEITLITFK